MTVFGIDYSGTRPDPKCLAANGVKFAGRYLEPANDWKTLTRKEADALHAAGIAIVGMFELNDSRTLKGHDAGVADALGVVTHMADVGMPDDRPVYFAVDFDASPTQLAGPVTAYFRGVGTIIPFELIGAYGGYWSIKYLFDNLLISWGHQAFAWSRGPDGKILWDSRAHLQQYAAERSMCGTNGDIDFNRGMFADFGQWPAPPPTEPPVPDPSLIVPYGYGIGTRTLNQTEQILAVHHHPEYVRRLIEWLGSKNGQVGVGNGFRTTQPVKPGAAPEGMSFHENQSFVDGFVGACAVDLVKLNLNGGVHVSPGWADVPAQGSDEAAAWGVHCNVSGEPWHMQPVEIDGWASWVAAGRPAPVPAYPLPTDPPPPPPPPPPTKDADMLFLAKLDTNQYQSRRGDGNIATVLRSNEYRLENTLLAQDAGPRYYNPLTLDEIKAPADVPVLTETQLDLYVGYPAYSLTLSDEG